MDSNNLILAREFGAVVNFCVGYDLKIINGGFHEYA